MSNSKNICKFSLKKKDGSSYKIFLNVIKRRTHYDVQLFF